MSETRKIRNQEKVLPRVVIVQRHIPFYRQGIYKHIAARFPTLYLYSGESLDGLETANGLPMKIVPLLRPLSNRKKLAWMSLFKDLHRFHPKVVITECALSLLNTWMLFFWRPLLGYKLVFWTHGYEDVWLRGKVHGKDRVRKLWFQWSDGIIFYSPRGMSEVTATIGDPGKCFVAPNTIDTQTVQSVYNKLVLEGREKVRARLGMTGINLLYIGRLTAYKNTPQLPDILRRVIERIGSCSLHIIGSGPDESEVRKRAGNLSEFIRFHGKITDLGEKGAYLFGSDMMLSPGWLGLNTVDALAFGCPVAYIDAVSLPMKHGPEVDYLQADWNGIVANSFDDLANQVADVCADPEKLKRLRENSRISFERDCSMSAQKEGVIEAIESILGEKKESPRDVTPLPGS